MQVGIVFLEFAALVSGLFPVTARPFSETHLGI
jgi:hypothetical protein